jgi:hypothetical protein
MLYYTNSNKDFSEFLRVVFFIFFWYFGHGQIPFRKGVLEGSLGTLKSFLSS